MSRETVDFGIDLGTTNSAIAVLHGVDTEVIKNNDGQEITPSTVRIDRRNRLYVGKSAKERSESDPENTHTEFKLAMGSSDQARIFKDADRRLEPEELSAEILKSLRSDVAQRVGEELSAAVITVPAAFELSACEATRRAAELAGLSYAPLLQEPTAAALAYGFQTEADNVFWLAYDFGGGTFDAAVINIRDGEFTVVNHRGDNFLGGKLIDWKIVEEILIPEAARQRSLTGLARGNPRWFGAVNKLKLAAEEAKIRLSRADSAEILVELRDDDGDPFEFEYDLSRGEMERIAEPFIVRSMNLCKSALSEAGLGTGDIEKLLLVGGPTLSPYLRERLADPAEGLGIPQDHGQDPITVVARGAAIFAGAQRMDAAQGTPPPPTGEYAVELEYRPVGPDTEPFIGGRVSGGDTAGFTLELVNAEAKPPWRSGKLALSPNGAFAATLWAEKGRTNTFLIELADPKGNRRPVTPDRLSYTVGVIDTQPPLTHSIGIGLDNNEVEWLVARGTPLPTRRRIQLRTTVGITHGQGNGMILIPVVEGEHRRADRNRHIGRLEIEPSQVRRDVPAGSEVDLTLKIDESRLVVARAYVPLLDEEFEHAINLRTDTVPEHDAMTEDVTLERLRLETARRQAVETDDPAALAVLRRIDEERIVADIDALVDAARIDPDAASTCAKRLRDLKAAVDEVEDALEWPVLVDTAHRLVPAVREIVETKGGARHRGAIAEAEARVQEAINARDADLLRQRLEELRGLAVSVLDDSGDLQFIAFDDLRKLRSEMRDPAEAARLITEGEQAASAGDSRALRQVNDRLRDMLPAPPPPPDPFSTVRRSL